MTSKLRVTGLYVGISPEPVNSPHKRKVVIINSIAKALQLRFFCKTIDVVYYAMEI